MNPHEYEKSIVVAPSLTDAAGYLSTAGAFGLFMDIAAEHAASLGLGMNELRQKDLFWITTKTRVRFEKRPFLGDTVTLRTWPETPERVRSNRSYELIQNGEVRICGKTEWAVMDLRQNRPAPTSAVYPPEMEFAQTSALDGPFARIPDRFDDTEPYATYTVRSTDIDVGGHMNNVAYVRVIAGSFSVREWEALAIRQMEVHFRAPCYEGDTLSLRRKRTDDGLDIQLTSGETTLLLARIS